MSSAYFLSEDDVKLLKEMANSYRQGTVENRKYRYSVYTEEAQAQDIQIVIPEEDIPASSGGEEDYRTVQADNRKDHYKLLGGIRHYREPDIISTYSRRLG